jgi:hypothetical protein
VLHNIARLPTQTDLADGNATAKFEATCVDERKLPTVPIGISIEAITGRTGHIFYDGNPLANHTIKKG